MKRLTEIAVRLRVITTSLLAILGFIALGILIGFWLGSHGSSSAPAQNQATAEAAAVPNQKWCDSAHRVPYIPASQCAGGSSCDRAFFMSGKYPSDWNAFCASITRQLQ
jgi:hypothetical protein